MRPEIRSQGNRLSLVFHSGRHNKPIWKCCFQLRVFLVAYTSSLASEIATLFSISNDAFNPRITASSRPKILGVIQEPVVGFVETHF